jgi:hypothetical protein
MVNNPVNNPPERILLNVLRMEFLSLGRYKVKVAENEVSLKIMNHNGKYYIVVKNLGRGRYIMRKVN